MDYRLVVAPMIATMLLMSGAAFMFAPAADSAADSANAFEESLADVVGAVTGITAATVDDLNNATFESNLSGVLYNVTDILKGTTGMLVFSNPTAVAAGTMSIENAHENNFGVMTGDLLMNVMLITNDVTNELNAHIDPVSGALSNIIYNITNIVEETTEALDNGNWGL